MGCSACGKLGRRCVDCVSSFYGTSPPPTLAEACEVIEALLAMCDLPENPAERKITAGACAFLERVKGRHG